MRLHIRLTFNNNLWAVSARKQPIDLFSDSIIVNLYSFALLRGSIRFSITPTNADNPMPPMVKLPNVSSAPPMPRVSISDAIIRLRVSPRSTLFFTRLLIPTEAMVPNSNSMMPPRTASGMVFSSALTLPKRENKMPKIAAMRMTTGSAILVSEMAPVTSD